MDFDKKKLERFVDRIISPIKVNEDFGLKCLHMAELNKRLEPFYNKYNPESNSQIHQEIFQHTISYLEKWGWSEASLEDEAGYLVSC